MTIETVRKQIKKKVLNILDLLESEKVLNKNALYSLSILFYQKWQQLLYVCRLGDTAYNGVIIVGDYINQNKH